MSVVAPTYRLYAQLGYSGPSYPPENGFGLYEQDLQLTQLGFTELGSFTLPAYTVLQLFHDQGFYEFRGPLNVPDTGAYPLARWHHGHHDEACYGSACGKRVVFRWDDGPWSIRRVRVIRLKPWSVQQLENQDHQVCRDNPTRHDCPCVEEFDRMADTHGDAQMHVNLLHGARCQHGDPLIPPGASLKDESHCEDMIYSQLQHDTFPTLDRGGPAHYRCGSRSFTNASTEDTLHEAHADPPDVWQVALGFSATALLLGFLAHQTARR